MIENFKSIKGKRKISMLTAYEFHMGRLLCEAGIDMILVGDSLGMAVLGYDDTKSVTIEDMVRHGGAVVRGVNAVDEKKSVVVVDMPIGSYDSASVALKNSDRILSETGCDAVKIEGRSDVVKAVVDSGVSVVGHTGLKPQSAERYCVQGGDYEQRALIINESKELEAAGAFALVLECVPSSLAREITEIVSIPTIGIGAGVECDGQVLVIHDLLGIYNRRLPKFVRPVIDLNAAILDSVSEFKKNVENGSFPNADESYNG